MKNKTIFVITVFEKCELDLSHFIDTGCTRSPCFRYTFEEAEEVVKNNMCDIWEHCYNYAVIEEIDCSMYPYPYIRKFYKYNIDTNTYEPIKTPEAIEHIGFCGIG